MIGRGFMSMLRVGLVLVLALAAAVAANIVLLNVATGPKDPVGKLSPTAGLVHVPAAGTPATSGTPRGSETTTTRHGDDGVADSKSDD